VGVNRRDEQETWSLHVRPLRSIGRPGSGAFAG
jgi:hypothetical protein